MSDHPKAEEPREYSGFGEKEGKLRGISRTNPFTGRTINVVADTPSAPPASGEPRTEVGEETCHRCGGPNLMCWHAPSPLWNTVMRTGEREPFAGIICPRCFGELAREAGVADYFCLTTHDAKVELPSVFGDGRVWDAAICRWRRYEQINGVTYERVNGKLVIPASGEPSTEGGTCGCGYGCVTPHMHHDASWDEAEARATPPVLPFSVLRLAEAIDDHNLWMGGLDDHGDGVGCSTDCAGDIYARLTHPVTTPDRDALFDEIDKRFGRNVARFVDARLSDSKEDGG